MGAKPLDVPVEFDRRFHPRGGPATVGWAHDPSIIRRHWTDSRARSNHRLWRRARGLGRGALGFASRAGKGLLGQLGGQFESHLQTAIQSFVKNSTQLMLERLVVILSSSETARYLGQSGGAAYDALVEQPTGSIWTFIHKNLSSDDLMDTIPGQLRHIEKANLKASCFQNLNDFWMWRATALKSSWGQRCL